MEANDDDGHIVVALGVGEGCGEQLARCWQGLHASYHIYICSNNHFLIKRKRKRKKKRGRIPMAC